MRILVDDVEVEQSVHAQKKVLLDTMILCYAHDKLSPHYAKASLLLKAAVNGLIKTYVSYQNLTEFYSIMTGKRVKRPLTPKEAADLCALYQKSVAIGKLLPTVTTYNEALESAGDLFLIDGEVFDCVLAQTAKGKADTVWTENLKHFEKYAFLNVENPLEWRWEEK